VPAQEMTKREQEITKRSQHQVWIAAGVLLTVIVLAVVIAFAPADKTEALASLAKIIGGISVGGLAATAAIREYRSGRAPKKLPQESPGQDATGEADPR
jgi:uncharacterized membrane protein